mmetsp:Transcript_40692/g.46004  ORF Transcript_40692/g.46004 Transcript_40692/m.46004 type:complete len:106 (-) Transcript_40692:5-322(-)
MIPASERRHVLRVPRYEEEDVDEDCRYHITVPSSVSPSSLSLSPSLSSVTGIIVTNTIGVIITIITTVIIARINNDFGNDQYQSNHQDIHLINGRELYHALLASS